MSDVSELVGHLRGFAELPFEGGGVDPLIEVMHGIASEAAAALETLAREVKYLETELEYVKKQREDYFSEYREKLTECIEMKILLAKLAPVVEAARKLANADAPIERGGWMNELRKALAALEAAHD